MWYTGETKAWRERAQLPLPNYFMQNKSHPKGCLEGKTILSTLAVAVDKWRVRKILHLEWSQGTRVSPAPSCCPPCRNCGMLSSHLGTKSLHFADGCFCVREVLGAASGSWGHSGDLEERRGGDGKALCLWARQGQNVLGAVWKPGWRRESMSQLWSLNSFHKKRF